MNILLSEECPIFLRENRRYLLQVLVTLGNYNHAIVHPETPRLRELLGEDDWRTFGESLSSVLTRASRGPITPAPKNCERCDPASLADYLSQKTVLIVENAVSDGQFVKMVLRRIAPDVERFISAQVDIRTGGGISNIPRELDLLAPSHLRTVPAGMPPRFIVLVDSDRTGPDHKSRDARVAIREAEKHGVCIHVLAKRSIENYIPDAELEELFGGGPKGELLAAILALDPVHRDYFPMKYGLSQNTDAGPGLAPYPSTIPRNIGLGDFVVRVLSKGMRYSSRQQIEARDHTGDLKEFATLLERSM